MKIVKYHDEGDTAITYALLKNINLKLKKYKNEPTQIKLLYNEDS